MKPDRTEGFGVYVMRGREEVLMSSVLGVFACESREHEAWGYGDFGWGFQCTGNIGHIKKSTSQSGLRRSLGINLIFESVC